MTETPKNIGLIVSLLIIIGFFIGLFMLSVFLIVNGIRDRKEGPSGKDRLSGKSSNDHDGSQPLPPEYTQFQ